MTRLMLFSVLACGGMSGAARAGQTASGPAAADTVTALGTLSEMARLRGREPDRYSLLILPTLPILDALGLFPRSTGAGHTVGPFTGTLSAYYGIRMGTPSRAERALGRVSKLEGDAGAREAAAYKEVQAIASLDRDLRITFGSAYLLAGVALMAAPPRSAPDPRNARLGAGLILLTGAVTLAWETKNEVLFARLQGSRGEVMRPRTLIPPRLRLMALRDGAGLGLDIRFR